MGDELTTGAEMELDWLDQKLRDEAAYIDDGGFTAAVAQKLPARRRASRRVRSLVLILAAVLASVVTYVLSSGGRFIFQGLAEASLFSPVSIFVAALAIGFLFTCAAAFAAAKRADLI
jgi:hypothetical protein